MMTLFQRHGPAGREARYVCLIFFQSCYNSTGHELNILIYIESVTILQEPAE